MDAETSYNRVEALLREIQQTLTQHTQTLGQILDLLNKNHDQELINLAVETLKKSEARLNAAIAANTPTH